MARPRPNCAPSRCCHLSVPYVSSDYSRETAQPGAATRNDRAGFDNPKASFPLGLGIDGELGASPVGTALDNDAWMKTFLHCFDMSDHADHPPLLLEAMERADGFIESSLVKRTKPFVNEQGFGTVTAR